MASRVILHIGLMKSGTTFLQGRLDANRQTLQEQGILFPGSGWQDQVHGLGEFFGFARSMRPAPGAWSELREQVDDHQGQAIISLELLAAMVRPNIARLVADFRGTPVSVVATVRDLGRNVPAMWQESLKNRYTYSWPEYVAGVRDRVGDAGKHFWRQHATGTILQRWSEYVPDLTLVTVPQSGGPETLWERFAGVCGIEGADWLPGDFNNPSLGAAAATYLLELNAATADLPWDEYNVRIKINLVRDVLSTYREHDQPIGFEVEPWLIEKYDFLSGRLEGLAQQGMRVVGDLAELRPRSVSGVDPTTVTDDQVEAVRRVVAQYRGASGF